jgi:hypothetical protein
MGLGPLRRVHPRKPCRQPLRTSRDGGFFYFRRFVSDQRFQTVLPNNRRELKRRLEVTSTPRGHHALILPDDGERQTGRLLTSYHR